MRKAMKHITACLATLLCSPAAVLAEETPLPRVLDKDLLLLLIILFALLAFSYVSHEGRDRKKKKKG
jgi:hypothetical protein